MRKKQKNQRSQNVEKNGARFVLTKVGPFLWSRFSANRWGQGGATKSGLASGDRFRVFGPLPSAFEKQALSRENGETGATGLMVKSFP